MLNPKVASKILSILRKDLKRVLKLKVPGFPKVYYSSFLLRDTHWFNTWASNGSIFKKSHDRTRIVFNDIRVGSYRLDQTTEGNLNVPQEEEQNEQTTTESLTNMPIDDRSFDGLRVALWRLSEAKFREALTDYNRKESERLKRPDPNRNLCSFLKTKKVRSIKHSRLDKIDESYWINFCKKISGWLANLPGVSSAWVDFDSAQESKIFVNSEGSVILQHSKVFTLSASLKKLTKEGVQIERNLVLNVADQKELPSLAKFQNMLLEKHRELIKLSRAQTIHAFSGPVLLYPIPAGLLFHEALGHRLEGNRLLSSGEGQTFKGQLNKKILPIEIDVYDSPKIKKFEGRKLIGAYEYDDEGVPAEKAILIEKGVLQGFLTSRAQIPDKKNLLNGHGRNSKAQRPISRMGVTVIRSAKAIPLNQLKELLLNEIKKQKKPFGMIVYETNGGETETTRYDFQGFFGEISYATLVYPDGKEILVRGVDFVGTPLQALNNIIAVSNELEMENGFCGAESGMIPISTISPAVLLRNLELQAKNENLAPPFLLKRPKK
ncbi:MAG TPA: metallopeptidase TldD-related protein [Oligoflexia bacterium]|nr:metallopeptidase TldD-related protein [Oligoflexia bacterium]HMP26822.1 metallopeptidase TldD-related protein [Oligoflexia bacterium]